VSLPVISGFTSAASITIASSQLKHLLGVNMTSASRTGGVLSTYVNLSKNSSNVSWADAVLGITCLSLLILMKQLPKIKSVNNKIGRKSQTLLSCLSISRNAIVALFSTVLAYFLDRSALNLTGDIPSGMIFTFLPLIQTLMKYYFYPGMPTITLPPYGLEGDFWQRISQLGSLLFTLPLVNIFVHVAVAKAFCNYLHSAIRHSIFELLSTKFIQF
jgi:sodium-independent sulfate anion transporter 11